MKNITITTGLAQAILNYLATQPYQAVFQLIEELSKQANTKPEEPVVEGVVEPKE